MKILSNWPFGALLSLLSVAFLAFSNNGAAQTPYFGHAILGISEIHLGSATVTVDSFDSSDPLASDFGQYSPEKRRANAWVSLGTKTPVSSTLQIGSAKIAGYVSHEPTTSLPIYQTTNGSVGDLLFLEQGGLGIQEGHLVITSPIQTPNVEVLFTEGQSPTGLTLVTPIITTNLSTIATSTNYFSHPNADLVTTNVVTTISETLPAAGTYLGSITTNWQIVMHSDQPPTGVYRNLSFDTRSITSSEPPAEGTYVGEVTVITRGTRTTYTYDEIVAYNYERAIYSWNYISSYSYHQLYFTTNFVTEIFDYVFENGNYQMNSLSGKVLVRGHALVHVAGNISFSGQGGIRIQEGASLKLFCSGADAYFGGNGIQNQTGSTLNCLYFGSPSNSQLQLLTDHTIVASFYAPQANIQLSGGGSDTGMVIGSIIGKSVHVFGNLAFHYDEDLLTAGPSWEAPLVIYDPPPWVPYTPPNTKHFIFCRYSGSGPVTFQWWKDGVLLTNNTPAIQNIHSSPLTLDSSFPEIEGNYVFVLSNSLGTATSAVNRVILGKPPKVESLSGDQQISVGDNLQLMVAATGTSSLSYQWYRSGELLEEQQDALLNIPEATLSDAGDYHVVVANSYGAVTSAVVNVVVVSMPVISNLSVDKAITVGSSFELQVTASGAAPFGYQWLRAGSIIPGKTAAVLQVSPASLEDSGQYQVVITNVFGSITSSVVNVLVGLPPSVSSISQHQVLLTGQNLQLQLSVSGTTPFNYQWYHSGSLLGQGTNALFSIAPATLPNAGDYFAVVSNPFGAITSAVVDVSVLGQPTPATAQKFAGEAVQFSATVSGSQEVTFQWHHSGDIVPGATSSVLALENLEPGDGGNYSVTVSNSTMGVISAPATLTVDGSPRILVSPIAQSVEYGESVEFSVTAAGSGVLHYQWLRNGDAISDETGASLDLGNVTLAAAGSYSVSITNNFGAMTSIPVALSVHLDTPQISGQPEDQVVSIGSAVAFTVAASSPAPVTYQWQYNGQNLAGETVASLQLNDVRFLQQGSYRCVLQNEAGTNVTRSATLSIEAPAAPFLSAAGTYNGLFAQPSALAHDSAGFFTLKVKTNGRYSGKFLLDGDAVSKSGIFSSNGQATAVISRARLGKTPLTVQLQLSFDDSVVGTVTDGTWNSDLTGFAGIISTNPVAGVDGRYTFLSPTLEGLPGSAPQGAGYALLNVKRAKISAAGYLPDGERLKQSVLYSKNGVWPFYARHYLGTNFLTNNLGTVKIVKNFRGSTIGWLTLSNQTPSGTLHWQMPANANRHYPIGLTNSGEIFGSSYVRPLLGRIVNLTNGVLSLSGGVLTEGFANTFFLKTNNTVQFTSTNKPTRLTFSATTGAFSGNFVDDTNRVVFRGAMLQNRNFGAGYFSPTNGSGNVTIESAD